MLPIRRATVDDVDQLVQLRLLLFEETGELVERDASAFPEAIRAFLIKSLPQKSFLAWIAESNSRIVASSGFVPFERLPVPENLLGKEGYILNMYTLPEWRGQGLATTLLQEIISYAKETGIRRLWLHATEVGRPVYEKIGFVAEGDAMSLIW